MSIFGIGAAAAGGKAGAITGTALAGAEGIVGAARGGGKAESAKGGKKQQMAATIGKLLEGLLSTQDPNAAGAMLKALGKLGQANPDALRQGLAANPAAAQALAGAS